jgi:hypothetical protein
LVAYAVSSGLPDLQLSVQFPFSVPNNPEFKASAEGDRLRARQFKQIYGTVMLRNNSGYSARNPAIIVRLCAMVYLPETTSATEVRSVWPTPGGDWVPIDFIHTEGIVAVQWDGGPTYSIHGHSTRLLPDLWLDNLRAVPNWGAPAMIVEILAEGYRNEKTIPVDFTVDGKSQFPREKTLPEWI